MIPPEPPVAILLTSRNGAPQARARGVCAATANHCWRAPFRHCPLQTGGFGGIIRPSNIPLVSSGLRLPWATENGWGLWLFGGATDLVRKWLAVSGPGR